MGNKQLSPVLKSSGVDPHIQSDLISPYVDFDTQ